MISIGNFSNVEPIGFFYPFLHFSICFSILLSPFFRQNNQRSRTRINTGFREGQKFKFLFILNKNHIYRKFCSVLLFRWHPIFFFSFSTEEKNQIFKFVLRRVWHIQFYKMLVLLGDCPLQFGLPN